MTRQDLVDKLTAQGNVPDELWSYDDALIIANQYADQMDKEIADQMAEVFYDDLVYDAFLRWLLEEAGI